MEVQKTIVKLYLVRHGQTDQNFDGIWLGSKMDVPLNEVGVGQSRNIKLDQDFDVIFSSPMKRTLQTAEIINETLQKTLITDKNLMERDKGALEGKTEQEVTELTNGMVNEATLAKQLDFDFSPWGGESIESVRSRIKNFVSNIQNYKDKKILVVVHMGIIRAMFSIYAGTPPESDDNSAVNVLDIPS